LDKTKYLNSQVVKEIRLALLF